MRDPVESEQFHQRKRIARMAAVDALPPELRSLVHDYGLSIVSTCIDLGITNPRHVKHLVDTILAELSPTRGTFSSQGTRNRLKEGP